MWLERSLKNYSRSPATLGRGRLARPERGPVDCGHGLRTRRPRSQSEESATHIEKCDMLSLFSEYEVHLCGV